MSAEPEPKYEYSEPCDRPGCDGSEAKLRCTQCKVVFYCNTNCQRGHWKTHKEECIRFLENYKEFEKKDREMDQYVNRSEQSVGSECCVCYEPIGEISDVMQLPCKHCFCVQCMVQLSGHHDNGNVQCPLCRESAGVGLDFIIQIYRNCANFLARAGRAHLVNKELMSHYCDLASAEIAKLGPLSDYGISPDGLHFVNQISCVRAGIAYFEGNFEECVVICNTTLTPPSPPPNFTIADQVKIELLEFLQLSLMDLGRYEDASTSLIDTFDFLCGHTKHCRNALFNGSRIYYYTGRYKDAISIAEAAVEMNRHYDNVYKYIVLSYKALGDWDSAIATQRKAVRYETPWDPKRTAQLAAGLSALVAERGAARVSDTGTSDAIVSRELPSSSATDQK